MSRNAAPGEGVALVISGLGPGGAERVVSHMAGYWAEAGRSVSVITFEPPGTPPFFPLPPDVRLTQLDLLRPATGRVDGLAANAGRVAALRQALREAKSAAYVAFTSRVNVLTVLAARGLGRPVIIAERSNPLLLPQGRLWQAAQRAIYPLADRVVFQSERVAACFSERVRRRAVIIPNPVFAPPTLAAPAVRPRRILLGMGRLDADKAYDRLVRAFAVLAARHPLWDLEIWGDGPERPRLIALAGELGLAGRVRLPGRTAEPLARMRAADLFALTSRYEGFPNVVLEALACGLPVVSLDVPFGPREIIRHGVDGLLAPPDDEVALVSALSRLMGDEAERARLAARAVEAGERFHPRRIMALWDALLSSVGAWPASAPSGEPGRYDMQTVRS